MGKECEACKGKGCEAHWVKVRDVRRMWVGYVRHIG